MEELWFRGLWLREYSGVVSDRGALWLTTLIFVTLHVIVYIPDLTSALLLQLTASWIFLALACGFITQRTGSLWGAVLVHTLTDILYLSAAFAA